MKIFVFLFIFCINLFSYEIINGEVRIITIPKNQAGQVSINAKKAQWIENPFDKNEYILIIPAGYKSKENISVKNQINNNVETIVFKLIQGDYKKENIQVSQSKVTPPKEVSDRIQRELNEAVAIYSKTSPTIYFKDKFDKPMNSLITSQFGNARLYNGSLQGYHSGIDFRAAVGTPIKAVNDGYVRLAKDRYYAGKSVIMDHGAGIYSKYYHMSELKVKEGDFVRKGQIIGLSGSTGRVTGPHLHFEIGINNISVNPLQFIESINKVLN